VSVVNPIVVNPPIGRVILRLDGVVAVELEVIVVDLDVHVARRALAAICPDPNAVIGVSDDVAADDDTAGSAEAADQATVEVGSRTVMHHSPGDRIPHAAGLWR
jgi:hypothetical protein